MSEDWIKTYNENAEKHNKRVKSIRENRLPKSCVKALDQAIRAMDSLHLSLCESVYNSHNCITMSDMIELGNAINQLKAEFQERELK